MDRPISYCMATKGKVTPTILNSLLAQINGIRIEKAPLLMANDYAENHIEVWHYWIDGKSTKAIPIHFYKRRLQIDIPYLSNQSSFELMDIIEKKVLEILEVKYEDLNESGRESPTEIMDWYINKDIARLLYSPEEEEYCYFEGINNRTIYFGKRIRNELKKMDFEAQKKRIFNIILQMSFGVLNNQYNPNVFYYPNKELKIQVLNNSGSYLLPKSDYLLITDGEKLKPIYINNQTLQTILPEEWTLIDEFSIVAPIISVDSWTRFVNDARKNDITNELYEDFHKSKYQNYNKVESWEEDKDYEDIYSCW